MKINAKYTCYEIIGATPLDDDESMTMCFLQNGKLLYTHKFGTNEHNRAYFYDVVGNKVNVYENVLSQPCNVFIYDDEYITSVVNGVTMRFKKIGE